MWQGAPSSRSFRRGSARTPVGGRRRPVEWRGSSGTSTQTLADVRTPQTFDFVLINAVDLEEFTHPTLVRTRGGINVYVSAGSQVEFFVGIQVVQAIAASNVPPVANEPSSIEGDFLYWYWGTVISAGGGGTNDWTTMERVLVDSRAKRRIPDESVVLISFSFVNDAVATTPAIEFSYGIRGLLMET